MAALLGGWCPAAQAANLSWDDAGNSASKLWSDNGNWSPDGAVQTNDNITIGDLANAAGDRTLFDISEQIASLTISNGASVVNSTDNGATASNTREIIVNGATTISGAGSGLVIYGRAGDGFDTNTLTVNSGATVTMNSQAGIGTAVLEIDSGVLDINAGGELIGNGRIDLEDSSPGSPFTVLQNDGEITASSLGLTLFAPAPRTLQITATSADARFDWDGVSGNGVLNVNGNATLDIDVSAESDPFGGVMNLATGGTIDIEHAWSLDSGTINANTPAFGLILPGNDPAPGPAARIAGANWTMTGGQIVVDDAWDSLRFDSQVVASGGVIDNTGTLIFNGGATIQGTVDFNMIGGSASLVVNSAVNIDTPDFNLDGTGSPGNVTTINAGGNLDLDLGIGADENFNHTINMNGGELDVTTTDNDWSLVSTGVINAAGGATSTINGETFQINGSINVTGSSTLNVNTVSEYSSTASVVVEAGSLLNHTTTTYNGGSFTGGGVFRKGFATIESDTTWSVATVDIDDGTTTVNNGASLAVLTDSIDDSGDGIDSTITVENTGELTIDLSDGSDVVFDSPGRLVYNGDAVLGSFLAAGANGSAYRFEAGSEFNVNGDGGSAVRIKLNGGTLNINDVGEGMRLTGGNLTPGSTNEITGGVINGPGELRIASGAALRGHGAINAQVDGDGSAQLIATGGVLNVNGGIQDIGTIGTSGGGSVLDVSTPWNTSVAVAVVLARGEIAGAAITNDNATGIQGQGLVSARVQNNQLLNSNSGGTLLFNNNLNDWDGIGGTGTLRASNGTLELQDNAAFLFTGAVRADAGGTVFANGFELEFDPGSTLRLAGGTYRSTHATDIGGAVDVTGAGSTLAVSGTTVFENGSSTTLGGDLHLENFATRIASGATFAGAGELINENGHSLSFDDGAVAGVQVTNHGVTGIAGVGTGRADVGDFLQSAMGALSMDVDGTALGQFDRLIANGIAQLGGDLRIATGGFGPTLGTTVQLITAAGGVLGTFDDVVDMTGNLPAGTQWEAVYNPNSVQLTLGLVLPGDFNNDGVVDAADYTVYRDNLGLAVTLPGDPTPGAVTVADHAVWAANYGATAPAPAMAFAMAAAVPEPTAAAMAFVAMAGLTTLRRRG